MENEKERFFHFPIPFLQTFPFYIKYERKLVSVIFVSEVYNAFISSFEK